MSPDKICRHLKIPDKAFRMPFNAEPAFSLLEKRRNEAKEKSAPSGLADELQQKQLDLFQQDKSEVV